MTRGTSTITSNKLIDHFVRRTDAGYELTEAGFEIARAVVAGTVRERPKLDATEIDASCPWCDAPVVAHYENHHLNVSCSECLGLWQNAAGETGVLVTFPLPPTGLADRTADEAFHAMLAFNLTRIRSFISGVCPDCSSEIEQSIDVCEATIPAIRADAPSATASTRSKSGNSASSASPSLAARFRSRFSPIRR